MSELPDTYGDVTAEYFALREGCGLVAGLHELVWVRGPDAVSFLDQLLSQDLDGLPPGGVARSLLLGPQGKLRAPHWVLRGEQSVGLLTDAGIGEQAAGDLARYRFRVEAEIDEAVRPVLELWGPEASGVLAELGLPAPSGWSDPGGVAVARVPVGGLDRFVLHGVDRDEAVGAGAVPAGSLAVTAVRIEAGEPLMGIDVDERTIPQETGLVDAAVSFDKGCYLGQELVARIDSRGHVNRHLRGVVVRENVIPPPGAELIRDDKPVGSVTSVAESLAVGAPVGLALVRREVAPGADLPLRWEGGATTAQVRELPLDDFASG